MAPRLANVDHFSSGGDVEGHSSWGKIQQSDFRNTMACFLGHENHNKSLQFETGPLGLNFGEGGNDKRGGK